MLVYYIAELYVLYPPTIPSVAGSFKVLMVSKTVAVSLLNSPLPTYTPFYKSVSNLSPSLKTLVFTINLSSVYVWYFVVALTAQKVSAAVHWFA